MQTFEAAYLDNIMLEAPLLCFQWYNVVDVLEKACDGVSLEAIRFGYIPQNIGSGQAIALHCQSEAHVGRVESR